MHTSYPKSQSKRRKYYWQRSLAAWLALCLLLSNLNFEIMLSYATEGRTKTFEIGPDVTAELKGGILKVRGHGNTEDFSEDSAPFLEFSDEIRQLVIEDGVTYIGSYLFYGLGELRGELKLPGSIVGFGDYAFSGSDREHAPHFTSILNEFEEGEIVVNGPGDTVEAGAATPSQISSPSQAKENSGERETPEEGGTEPSAEENPYQEASPSQAQSLDQAVVERHWAPLVGDSGGLEASGSGEEEPGNGSSTESGSGGAADTAEADGAGSENAAQSAENNGDSAPASDEGGSEDENGKGGTGGAPSRDNAAAENEASEGGAAGDVPLGSGTAGKDTPKGEAAGNGSPKGENAGNETSKGESAGDETPEGENAGSEPQKGENTGNDTPEGGTAGDNSPQGEPGENNALEEESVGGESLRDQVAEGETAEGKIPDVNQPEGTAPQTDRPAGGAGRPSPSSGAGSPQTPQTKGNPDEEEFEYDIEFIFEQKIENPETLFYEGQSGFMICFPDNGTFIEAAEYAGYQLADGSVSVTLDDAVELELPVLEGQLILPECPQEISGPDGDEDLYRNEFVGWIEEGEASADARTPGEFLDAVDGENLKLYSVWETVGKYEFRVETNREGDTAVYTLTDSTTGELPENPDLYQFQYQWQYSEREELGLPEGTPSQAMEADADAEQGWNDIPGADNPVYRRAVETGGITLRFRCAVTAVKLTRARSTGQVTMYSEPVNAVVKLHTVYVAQTGGNDANTGVDREHAVSTLEQAAKLLTSEASGGTAESNQIILVEDYEYDKDTWHFLRDNPVPVTIKGIDGGAKKRLANTYNGANVERHFYLYSDIIFDSVILDRLMHIYCNGHDLTICESAETIQATYLYGAGSNQFDSKVGVGKLEVYGGTYTRIVGYIRNSTMIDAVNKEANITVGGNANVDLIVAGSASGEVKNANVVITVEDRANVTKLVGGCQGYSTNYSPYSGHTAINIKGGAVKELYGAGSGRSVSIPTFLGNLEINVSGGEVVDLYGSGSAAYVTSTEGRTSHVNIAVSGGTVRNIYAAGRGGDSGVTGGSTGNQDPDRDRLPKNFGSLSGEAKITISGSAVVTGSIYASGEGYSAYDTSENAYLNGAVQINIEGGTINQNIFGGGKGVEKDGYGDCARVEKGSSVKIQLTGGTVKGNVYGGGELARVDGVTSISLSDNITVEGNIYGGGKNASVTGSTSVSVLGGTIKGYVYGGGENASVEDSTSVTIAGGLVQKNIYGGGSQGLVEKRTNVTVKSGTVNGSVYGGALGVPKERFVKGGSTVNMTGGWVRGNLYGGSELSDDGPESGLPEDLIFVNLVGGTVSGKVFGGGYQGIINGSTHVHIGVSAMGKCNYYKAHPAEKPELAAADLTVGGSVYAGGDYGSGSDYDAITIKGFSHVYIDGEGYFDGTDGVGMQISGGIFGSGASCDAGDKRLVTLDHYGTRTDDGSGGTVAVSSTLTSIQRADQVRLINSHVRLSGQSDVANYNQTALYSLNRIGDQGSKDGLGELGNSLTLADGSTLILDSASIELANFKSVGSSGDTWKKVGITDLSAVPNTIFLTTGTVFRVSSTPKGGAETYGAVTGYAYMMAEDTASAYAYARFKTAADNNEDGGFAVPNQEREIDYTNVLSQKYRYWHVAGTNASAIRETVLTAQKLNQAPVDGFSVAEGSIELPPAKDEDSVYKIQSITIPGQITLVDAAKKTDVTWVWPAGSELETEKENIRANPLSTFGLYISTAIGFQEAVGDVISGNTAKTDSPTSIVGENSKAVKGEKGSIPKINFSLTYQNDGITVSQDLDEVVVVIQRYAGDIPQETVTLNVGIVTKAAALSEQEVDLYATQTGTYTGKLIIPAGASRTLSLSGIETTFSGNTVMKPYDPATPLSEHEIAVTMRPVQSQGWMSSGLMEGDFDLSKLTPAEQIPIGSTDSRYEAAMEFTLYNVTGGFVSKDTADLITLTLKDDDSEVPITLRILWKDSIVTSVKTEKGKQYNGVYAGTEKTTISPKSSVTSVFTMGTLDEAQNLWLELQQDGGRTAIPAGTKLTLLGQGERFYVYKVTGGEEDQKIPLTGFTQMWNDAIKISGNVGAKPLTVIMDFDESPGAPTGDYSFRLRNDKSADSMGSDFTVDNSPAEVTLQTDGEGFARGSHVFQVKVLSRSDTRLLDGAAVAVSAEGGFPQGTVFRYDNHEYYPVEGTVYLPMDEFAGEIVMDTVNTAGLTPGSDNSLTVVLFSMGASSGGSAIDSERIAYAVKANPDYGLKAHLSGESRVTVPGTELNFTVSYSVLNAEEAAAVRVETYRKENGNYVGAQGWTVSGADRPVSGSGSSAITVRVPDHAEPGTYRLIFRLGDQETPYNVIVRAAAD